MKVREAQEMAHFTNMISKKSNSLRETRTLLVELEDRHRMFQEIVGDPPDEKHAMSVLIGILDSETLKHTAVHRGLGFTAMKQKVREFANMVGAKGKAMQWTLEDFRRTKERKKAEVTAENGKSGVRGED